MNNLQFKIVDNSMDNNTELKTIPKGWTASINPKVTPRVKDTVLAKLSDGEYVIRKLVNVDNKQSLKPLNPSYPVIENNFKIIGKVEFAGFPC